MDAYQTFLDRKKIVDIPTGFEPNGTVDDSPLFDFQKDVVKWACRRGRAALLEDCGLGKTPQQLVWAQQCAERTGKKMLVLAPVGVTHQHVREGKKFGIDVRLAKSQKDVSDQISVTNYERLHLFDASEFDGLVADESSILKNYSGATRNAVIDFSARMPNRLACSATAAPNDYMELGNHSEFLGVMTRTEMLATFFVHDGGDTAKWRLKGHAETEFWKWLCSWAVNIRRPSDLGYPDGKFKLPKLRMHEHIVRSSHKVDGYLFALPASSLSERRDARRGSLAERVDKAAELVGGGSDQWVMWCNLNSESEALAKKLGAAEVRGATSEEERERITLAFLDGTIKRVVTKPSLWGFGMNLQCCHNTALVGLSDSYEEFYQVVRRFWRFGQDKPVDAHIVISDLEGAVLANIKRKERDAEAMGEEMVRHMADISSAEIKGVSRNVTIYNPQADMVLPEWLRGN